MYSNTVAAYHKLRWALGAETTNHRRGFTQRIETLTLAKAGFPICALSSIPRPKFRGVVTLGVIAGAISSTRDLWSAVLTCRSTVTVHDGGTKCASKGNGHTVKAGKTKDIDPRLHLALSECGAGAALARHPV